MSGSCRLLRQEGFKSFIGYELFGALRSEGPAGGGEQDEDAVEGVDDYLCAKMHLVDLAGSERLGRTQAEADRRAEGEVSLPELAPNPHVVLHHPAYSCSFSYGDLLLEFVRMHASLKRSDRNGGLPDCQHSRMWECVQA